jgi:hypothetical protein
LLSVVHALNSLQIQTRPSPRQSAARWAEVLFPASAPGGGPNFSEPFNWLAVNVDAADVSLHSAIALRRELVKGTWWARSHPSYDNDPAPANAEWRMVALHASGPVEQAEFLKLDEQDEITRADDFSEVYQDDETGGSIEPTATPPSELSMEGVPLQDLRFVRHLRRVVGEVGLRAMLLFAMTDRWFGSEAETDEDQNEFESELFSICMWARKLYPGRAPLNFEGRLTVMGYSLDQARPRHDVDPVLLKQLIYKLSRTFVCRPVEMNLDLPVLSSHRGARVL